jgi:hypothetical protein
MNNKDMEGAPDVMEPEEEEQFKWDPTSWGAPEITAEDIEEMKRALDQAVFSMTQDVTPEGGARGRGSKDQETMRESQKANLKVTALGMLNSQGADPHDVFGSSEEFERLLNQKISEINGLSMDDDNPDSEEAEQVRAGGRAALALQGQAGKQDPASWGEGWAVRVAEPRSAMEARGNQARAREAAPAAAGAGANTPIKFHAARGPDISLSGGSRKRTKRRRKTRKTRKTKRKKNNKRKSTKRRRR